MTENETKSGSTPEHDREREVRCGCGALVARRVPGGIELRCRRCKRTIVVPLEGEQR
jgi:hypothetical protein